MAKTTLRDKVWKDVLARTVKGGVAVRPSEVAEKTGASERMTRQCLLSIVETGLVERRADPNGEVRYVPSPNVDYSFD